MTGSLHRRGKADYVDFGSKIKKLRSDNGWSQDEFGELVGVHGRHIAKYEAGRALPNAETLVRIARGAEVSIDFLLLDEEPEEQVVDDPELRSLFCEACKLCDEDRAVIRRLVEAFIKTRKIEEIMHDPS